MKLKKVICAVALAATPMLAFATQVDVNKAGKDELMKGLQGITEQQADAIIKYREKHGPFIKLNELTFVEGVGRELILPNYDRLTIGNVTAADKKNM
jgi:competence ComEA-like helix-hairpin-helix protein